MPSGFEAINEAGALQFSSEALAYKFLDKGTLETLIGYPVSPAQNYVGTLGSSAQLSGSLPSDLIAVSCSTHPIWLEKYNGGNTVMTVAGPVGTSLNWYRFRPFSSHVQSGNVGLQLFDAAGALTYSSEAKPMVHVGAFNISTMASGMDTFVSLPPGRTYAYLINASRRRRVGISGATPQFDLINDTDGNWNPEQNVLLSAIRNSETPKGFYINEVGVEEWMMVASDYSGYVVAVDVTGY